MWREHSTTPNVQFGGDRPKSTLSVVGLSKTRPNRSHEGEESAIGQTIPENDVEDWSLVTMALSKRYI